VDFVHKWADKTGLSALTFLLWLGLATSKWHSWKSRYGKANEHNAWMPRDHWLTDPQKQAILALHDRFPLEGYRRLTFMMLDADVVACSPASVYRVLKAAGLLTRHHVKPTKKGTGFEQPLRVHEH
jgi:putative transposase